ncbi:Capsular polysaccharide biosynthesis protein [Parafrankia irregularis]|uniref:Capsular polysaccharide biosynthesis protein n=1 Tax=Parafrankia irregularis TaxID=795642 RepID=A0A0S4QVL6_9ACTN|nr:MULTISPECIES: hypothetical protein [Parafrankia]MBE3205002.1 hypothetical protein [Parafrankia sp. CH37]CUU58522.1 Capsular polysaccharide biosynthesis protein [Parafrankia irregularis]
MQLNGPLTILLRRWRLTAAGVALTVVAAIGAFVMTPVSYQGSSQVFLLPSAVSAETGKVDNPYLGFGQSLRITAEVISRLTSTAEAVDEAVKHGATAGYMIGIPTDAAGPVLNVQAEGPDRAAVVTTVNYVVTKLGEVLDQEQEKGGAPRSSWFVLNKITEEPVVTVAKKARYTQAAMAFAVCCLLTFLGVLLFDRLRSPRPAGDGGAPMSPTGPSAPTDNDGYGEIGRPRRPAAGPQEHRERQRYDEPSTFDGAPQGRSDHDTERTYRIPLRRPMSLDDDPQSGYDRRPLGSDRKS